MNTLTMTAILVHSFSCQHLATQAHMNMLRNPHFPVQEPSDLPSEFEVTVTRLVHRQ